jgi:hypothetical protein
MPEKSRTGDVRLCAAAASVLRTAFESERGRETVVVKSPETE